LSVQVSGKKQIIFYFLILIIFIFALEGVLRGYAYVDATCAFMKSDVYPELNYFEKKHICTDFYYIHTKHTPVPHYIENQHTSTLNINNFGFRGNDINYEKLENTYRIFVVGGSTTYGAGSTNDNTTIPGYLQTLLNQKNLKYNIEVINAGISAYFSLTETNLIKNKLIDFKPDLIIVYDGWNDIETDIDFHLGETYQTSFIDDSIQNLNEIVPDYQSPKILRSIQAKLKQMNMNEETNSEFVFDGTKIPQKIKLWKERWTDICNMGSNEGFDVIITLQPLAGSGNKLLSDQENKYYEKRMSHFIDYYSLYGEALIELDNSCTNVKDLRFAFDDYTDTILYDGGHVVSKGNEIIANEMLDVILSSIDTTIKQ